MEPLLRKQLAVDVFLLPSCLCGVDWCESQSRSSDRSTKRRSTPHSCRSTSATHCARMRARKFRSVDLAGVDTKFQASSCRLYTCVSLQSVHFPVCWNCFKRAAACYPTSIAMVHKSVLTLQSLLSSGHFGACPSPLTNVTAAKARRTSCTADHFCAAQAFTASATSACTLASMVSALDVHTLQVLLCFVEVVKDT
eukprot:1777112-Amphidinium_carterae.1